MFKVKYIVYVPHPKKKKKTFKEVHYAQKDDKSLILFKTRRKAKNWIRNHNYLGDEFHILED